MDATITKNEHQRQAQAVTAVGAALNLALAVVKVVTGLFGHSAALVADGIHSLSDLGSDALVMYAARHGQREADELHPYGHARIETAVTVGLGLFLIAVALGLGVDAGRRILTPESLVQPEAVALGVALLSILSKEWLYRYTMEVARRLRSPMLRANAWHHRTDAISSVVVLVGVGGALAGLPALDAFAAIGVALMIARIGWDLSWHAVRELVDTGLEPERLDAIRESILAVEGVQDLHMLRTRRMGSDALVDVHVQVHPRLTVSEGHQIGEFVRARLLRRIDEVSDVTVHIDPEDDGSARLCQRLPLRAEFLSRLREAMRPVLDPTRVQSVNLHYLSGRIHVDVILPLALAQTPQGGRDLARELSQALEGLDGLGTVQVYFH